MGWAAVANRVNRAGECNSWRIFHRAGQLSKATIRDLDAAGMAKEQAFQQNEGHSQACSWPAECLSNCK
jgi:hypothetical protein